MYQDLIDYFHKGIKTTDGMREIPFREINEKAVILGYVIHPDCCNEIVDRWLDSLTPNYNATFYKEWNDVISRNRFELFVDQILHYATTYGTDFSLGNGFVPNDGSTVPSIKTLKVIEPATEAEFYEKCMDVLSSGVALKQNTMFNMASFTIYYAQTNSYGKAEIVEMLSRIKNKEAQACIASKLGFLPNDEFGILRCLVFKYTGNCLLIKSRNVIKNIKLKAETLGDETPILSLDNEQLNKLSRIFYRFKPIFLAMKTKETAETINRIRRLAKKNHSPFHVGFWENIVSTKRPLDEVCRRLEDLDNFRKIRLLMLIRERIMFETKSGVFPIRNGKLYVREDYTPKYDLDWLGSLFTVIKTSLVNSLSRKACKIRLPENYSLTLPSSEKTFVGNFPFGTSFEMTKNNVIGVYWRNEWCTRDYDLSMTDVEGELISWRNSYYNENSSVIYSGDMTNADPEAVEALYINEKSPDGFIMLNKFSGQDKSKFRFFYGNEVADIHNMKNHMIDPNSIKFDEMVEFDGQGQKTIGMILDNRFMFMDFESGKNRASSAGKYVNTVVEAMKRKAKSFIDLKDILLEAGFEPVKEDECPDIDFTNLEKDTLIKLLSKED